MRLVVVKDIIVKDLVTRNVYRQKQCLPAYRQQHILFESASCKNPETSCLESRRKFDRLPVNFGRNRYCTGASAIVQIFVYLYRYRYLYSYKPISQIPVQPSCSRYKIWKSGNPYSTRNFTAVYVYVLIAACARTSRDRGWGKKKFARR